MLKYTSAGKTRPQFEGYMSSTSVRRHPYSWGDQCAFTDHRDRLCWEPQGHGWESALVDMSPSGQQLLTSELIFVTNQLSTLCCTFKVRRPRHHQEAGSSQQCNCRQGSG